MSRSFPYGGKPRLGGLGYQEFLGHLDRGSFSPIYLLTGDEDFLVQAALDQLIRAALDPAAKDFNFSVMDGETASADAILTAAQSLPAFAPRRLVVIKNAEQIPAVEANRLVGYLKDPSPTTCLVCVASSFDARRSFFQTLKSSATVVVCRMLTDSQVTEWLHSQAKLLNRSISPDAILFLKERVGRDLYALQNELAKAAILSGNEKRIKFEDVQAVCGAAGEVTVYDLLNALAHRKLDRAVQVVGGLMDEGEAPLKILSSISYRFRLIWKVKQAMMTGHSDAALMRLFGLGQWAGTAVLTAAKAYPEPDLRWAFKRFIETDAGLKGGMLPARMILELLVMDLCAGKKKGLRRFLGRQPLLYL